MACATLLRSVSLPTSQVQWNDEIEEQEIRKLIEKQELLEKKKKEAEELLQKEKLLKQVSNILELGKTQVCAVYCTNWDALCSTTAV